MLLAGWLLLESTLSSLNHTIYKWGAFAPFHFARLRADLPGFLRKVNGGMLHHNPASAGSCTSC